MDQSYIFFLYYLQYSPATYQLEAKTDHSFSKFEFRPINWDKEVKSPDILYIGNPNEFPDNIKSLKVINYLNGKPTIKILQG